LHVRRFGHMSEGLGGLKSSGRRHQLQADPMYVCFLTLSFPDQTNPCKTQLACQHEEFVSSYRMIQYNPTYGNHFLTVNKQCTYWMIIYELHRYYEHGLLTLAVYYQIQQGLQFRYVHAT